MTKTESGFGPNRGAMGFTSSAFYHLSLTACGRAYNERRETIIAVVFAAFALEAFLNELTAWALLDSEGRPSAPIAKFANQLYGVGVKRRTAARRLRIARKHLGGNKDEWAHLQRECNLLIDLRNEIVHLKADTHRWNAEDEPYVAPESRLLRELADRKLIDSASRGASPWLWEVEDPRVGVWAYNTSAKALHYVIQTVPWQAFQWKLMLLPSFAPLIDTNTLSTR